MLAIELIKERTECGKNKQRVKELCQSFHNLVLPIISLSSINLDDIIYYA